jgi:hypothetical protein
VEILVVVDVVVRVAVRVVVQSGIVMRDGS